MTARRPCSHSPGLTAGSGTSSLTLLSSQSKYRLQGCRVPSVAVPVGALALASNCRSSSSRSFHHQQIAVAAAHLTGRLSAPPPCQTTFSVHDRRNLQIVQLLQVGLSASSCLASIYKHQKPAVALQPPLTTILSIAIPLSAICNCNGFLQQPHPRPHLAVDSRSFPLKHRSRHRLWLSSRLSPPTPTSRKAFPKMLSTRRVVFCHALTQFHSHGSKSFSCPEQEAVLRPFSTALMKRVWTLVPASSVHTEHYHWPSLLFTPHRNGHNSFHPDSRLPAPPEPGSLDRQWPARPGDVPLVMEMPLAVQSFIPVGRWSDR